jgi:hypothetical protein
MAFSNILDISSFFIGMLINLLLIALICYYFKRKYETLEVAQNEQAKILYNIIQQQQNKKTINIENLMNSVQDVNLDKPRSEENSNSDSDSESDSDSDSESELEVEADEIKTVQVDEVKAEVLEEPEVVVTKVEDYSKMTIKELRDVLSRKGISSNNKMKKTDLLQLIETGTQDTLNLILNDRYQCIISFCGWTVHYILSELDHQ